MIKQGKIIKGIAGFYYVEIEPGILYECKAKGRFRSDNIKPLVGDNVQIEIVDEVGLIGNIVEICERKNELIRPAVSNVDTALVTFAIKDPIPSINMLLRFLIMIRKAGVGTKIVFTKSDLATLHDRSYYAGVFGGRDVEVFFVSNLTGEGIDELRDSLRGQTVVLAGPSGVGKSSLLNNLLEREHMETGEISDKIKRGKHTTRFSMIIPMGGETYLVDTPGFTSLYIDLEAVELKDYYDEFYEYEGKCRFSGCTHTHEPGCQVKEAVNGGAIHRDIYKCYVDMYNELIKTKKSF